MTTRRLTKSVLKTGASSAALSIALALSGHAVAGALPDHGHFVSGHGTIGKGDQSVTVKQSSTTGIINWNKFSIGSHDAVNFKNGAGATLNRVTGSNLSTIAGRLHATGSLYLMNSAGVIISGTGRVVTGGSFVATSGTVSDTAFENGQRTFKVGAGNVANRGTIVSGGTVALSGSNVGEAGTIRASAVDLRAGHALWVQGNVLARGANGAGGAVRAAAHTIVIGTNGEINASANAGAGGLVRMISRGTTAVAGTITANGVSKGGFIETSGARVHVADSARISTLASHGEAGTWLIDPTNFTIAPTGGDITGATLSSALSSGDVVIASSGSGSSGAGDIFVDDAVSWSSNTLTLDSYHSIDINDLLSASTAAGLTLVTNDGGTGGDYFFNGDGRVAFTGYSNGDASHLTINTQAYTLENSVAALASAIAGTPSGFFALANNYDASGDSTYNNSPIPTTFTGTFEGLGNAVSNLTINNSTAGRNVGLFATVSGGTVRDVAVTDLSLTNSGGGSAVGGLIGDLESGTVSGAYVTGSISNSTNATVGGLVGNVVTNSTVQNSYSKASITATASGSTVGGLVGEAQTSTFDNDYATGAISGVGATTVGGFAGGLDAGNSLSGDYATGAVTAASGDAGGFAGYSTSTNISDSHASGTVTSTGNNGFAGGFVGVATNGAIQTSFAMGAVNVSGSSTQAGGFVANNSGTTVTTSYASGDVTGTAINDIIGGFVSENLSGGSISQSYASGEVSGGANGEAGGFAGFNNATILQTYATGNVSAGSGSQVGGFAGNNGGTGTIDESYSLGKVSGGSSNGGFVGGNANFGGIGTSVNNYYNLTANPGAAVGSDPVSEPDIHGLTSASMLNSASYQGWTFGTSTSGTDWVIVDLDGSFNNGGDGLGGTTPMLLSEYSTTITNAHQLQLMELDLSANYTLANDIDATATAGAGVWSSNGFVPIGTNNNNSADAYTGTFNGKNHVIAGLFIDSDPTGSHSELSWVGLFGYLGGTAENVGLSNVNITDNNGQGARIGVGGLAGDSYGTITNDWVSGSVTATQKDGQNIYTGGLVGGMAFGTISDSHSSATVTDLGVGAPIGGLVGINISGGTIQNSYATGDVTGGDNTDVGGFIGFALGSVTITGSYATGNVSAGDSGDAGGFVGTALGNSSIIRSFALGNVTGKGDGEYGGFAGSTDGLISESYAGGNVSKIAGSATGGDLGGFIGGIDQDSHITQSYSTGAVSGDSTATLGGFVGSNGGNIDESYTLSKVTGGEAISTGAFVGNNNTAGSIGATVEDFYDSSVNGSLVGTGETSGSGSVNVGALTTAQMYTASNFTGWSSDFGSLGGGAGWVIFDNNGTLNNAGGVTGGTMPILLGEYSTSIADAHQLQLMQLDRTADYTLVRDIDLSETGAGLLWGNQGFIPIGGNNVSTFTGTFDGDGHTISGLFINNTTLGVTSIGLFGLVDAVGVVKNVVLDDAVVETGTSSSNIGALVGVNEGTVSNAIVRGSVSGGDSSLIGGAVGDDTGTISQSSFTGTVTENGGNSTVVGGLVGYVAGEVTASYASATIEGAGTNGYAGGLVGVVDQTGSVHGSYANGQVIGGTNDETGGFVGEDRGLIDTSYATGAVSNFMNGSVGGFAGVLTTSGDIEESYERGAATAGSNTDIGAFVAQVQGSGTLAATKDDFYNAGVNTAGATGAGAVTGVIGLSSTAMLNSTNFIGWTFGALGSNADWVIVDTDETLNNASGATGETAPMLLNEYSTSIINAHQLQLMQLDPTANYTVTTDFDASGTAHSADVWGSHGFVPVGDDPDGAGFTGSFDGGDHTITGLTIQNASVSGVGLFSFLDEGGTISNVTLANVSIVASGGNLDAGAVAGFSNGAISNVTVSGSVSANGLDSDAGGVVGFLNGSLSNAHSSATVSDADDNDGQGAGGLVGFNNFGTITQSSASGNVSMNGDDVGAGGLVGINAGAISQSFATGSVTVTDPLSSSGSANVAGGLVGANDGGAVSDSYAMGNVSITGPEGQLGGGFVGENINGGAISRAYSLGMVSASTKGGFVGLEQSSTITQSYWDTQTSGLTGSHGEGSTDNGSAGVTGLTTATLESALPTGFSGSTWSIVAGTSMPYLNWQFASGAPQVVSGTMRGSIGGAGISGQTISLLQDGVNLNSAQTGGSLVTYANGFYYFLLAPGSIASSSNAGVIAYDTADHALTFADQASGSLTGLDLTKNYGRVTTSQTSWAAADGDLLDAVNGNSTLTALLASTPNLEIDSAGSFSIDQAITGSGTLIIDAASGSVNQATGDDIAASKLLLEGAANYTLTDANNAISTLAMKGNGSLALVDHHALTIGEVEDVKGIDAGGGVTLTTTSGGISITQQLVAENHPVTLNSASTIKESGSGFIKATNFSGTSHGAVTLSGNNKVADLGSFDTGGDNSFLLKNVIDLQVDGFVNAGASDLTLTTTGNGHDIIMGGTLLAETVILNSAATITEPLGVIDASNLVGTAHGNVTLDNASNDVLDIQGFTTDGGDFTFVDNDDLTVSGTLDAGAGDVSLKTLGSGHDMVVNGTVAGNIVTLVSAGALSEGSNAVIDATTLTGSSHSAATLDSAHNVITNLAAFTSGGNFALFDKHDLHETGIINAGSHTLELKTIGSGHDISIGSKLKGGTVDLISAATIAETSGGIIDADSLTGSATGDVDFGSATNAVSDLAAFVTTGAFTLVDATDLETTGDVEGQSISLTTKGSGHDIKIGSDIVTAGDVSLVSAGTIGETSSAVIEADTISGSSVGGTKLKSKHNSFTNLGAFTAGGALSVTDNASLKTTGTVNAGSHAVTLKTVGGTHGITIASKIEGGTVKLTSADAISENSAGQIVATTLTGSSGAGTELTSAQNNFANLGAFTSGSQLEITDDADLKTTGAVNAGSHVLTLATVGANHDLQIASTLTGATVNLNVTGAASETAAGAIKATTLNVTAGTGITLTSTKNKITTVGTDKTKTGPNKITK